MLTSPNLGRSRWGEHSTMVEIVDDDGHGMLQEQNRKAFSAKCRMTCIWCVLLYEKSMSLL